MFQNNMVGIRLEIAIESLYGIHRFRGKSLMKDAGFIPYHNMRARV